MTARPPMRANSVGGTSFANVAKAPTRREAEPLGPSRNRISPDTNVALRIPTLEDLPTPATVLSQVQCDHDMIGHRKVVVWEFRRYRPSVTGWTHGHPSG